MPSGACEAFEGHAVGIVGGFQGSGDVQLTNESDRNTGSADNVDGDSNNRTPSSTGHGAQSWSAAEQSGTLPTRERSSGPSYIPVQGLMPPGISIPSFGASEMDAGSTNDMSVTSADTGPSNRATPISSTASEQRQTLAPGGRMTGSGRNSFEASPVSSHQNLGGMGGSTSQSEVDRSVNAFYGNPGSFSMSPGVTTGLTPDQRYTMPETPGGGEFSMPQGWHEIAGQPAMTPVANGVLHSIMAMGPMDTMDLGWGDANP